LRVLEAQVPGLDQRRADLRELARALADEIAKRHRLPSLSLSASALRAIEAGSWPGHVRELAHALESAAITARMAGTAQVEAAHLGLHEPPDAGEGGGSLEARIATFRAEVLRDELEARDWNVLETARALGIARSYAYKLIQRHGLRRDAG
jgi:DNA-binding NtrC family response regulator